jgi:phosphonoacetate hydrolase
LIAKSARRTVTINNRTYRASSAPVVGICLDGTSPSYLRMAEHVMPRLRQLIQQGASGLAQAVIPSFTNPNNVAIMTGVPPNQNGICGNYYYDRRRDCEVMMDDPAYLRCPTILAGFRSSGYEAAAITTKDKLRRLLGEGLEGACCSIERPSELCLQGCCLSVQNLAGREAPGIYDPEISLYCIEAGVGVIGKTHVDLLYLSTTDYVQHKFAPDSAEAIGFYAKLDPLIGALDDAGAIVGITADHGMNGKTAENGSPNVRFLESALRDHGMDEARVILPITDPHVVHHGALGSYATVYLDRGHVRDAREILEELDGVEIVLSRREAARWFHLPLDSIGDLVVLSGKKTVLGRTPEWHDLSAVDKGLRSHGGLHERTVPLIVNRKLKSEHADRLEAGEANNYDLFDFLLNGVED